MQEIEDMNVNENPPSEKVDEQNPEEQLKKAEEELKAEFENEDLKPETNKEEPKAPEQKTSLCSQPTAQPNFVTGIQLEMEKLSKVTK